MALRWRSRSFEAETTEGRIRFQRGLELLGRAVLARKLPPGVPTELDTAKIQPSLTREPRYRLSVDRSQQAMANDIKERGDRPKTTMIGDTDLKLSKVGMLPDTARRSWEKTIQTTTGAKGVVIGPARNQRFLSIR